MNIDIIDNLETFQALKSNWEYVYQADSEAQFFISWIWIAGKLKKYEENKLPWFILAVKLNYDASEYVAFFPLEIEIKQSNPGDFYNQLATVGVTDADYSGFICLPQYEEEIVTALAQYLQQQETWSVFELEHILTTNKKLNLFLKKFVQPDFEIQQLNSEYFTNSLDEINNQIIPYVVLPDSWDDYLQNCLSSNTRQKIRRFFRKIESSDEFRLTEVDADNLEHHIEILIKLWRANWEGRKGAESCDAIVHSMNLELHHCFENNCLSLLILWKKEQPLGAIANLIDRSKKSILFFVGSRDETFKELPPGFVLHAYGIQSAINNGFKIYDFLMGNEAYKYSFGAKERYIQTILVQRQNWIQQNKKLDQRTLPIALEITKNYHRANHLVEAEKGYRQILAVQANHPEALYGLGVLRQRQGQYQAAQDLFNHLIQVEPNQIKAWFSLGNIYQFQNQLSDAEQAYQQALNLQPESSAISSAIYHNLGYTFQLQNKWQNAIACYQKARELQPDSVEAEVIWANALDTQGQLSPEQQADYALKNSDLGNKRLQASDFSVAIEYYRQGISLNPKLAEAHYHLGVALEKQSQNNYPEAISCYQKAIELQPNYLEAEVSLANLLDTQGKLSPEQQADLAIKNNELGNKCLQEGYCSVAIEYYRQAIALSSDWAEAHYHLGIALEKQSQNNYPEAIACYQKAIELQPNYLKAELSLVNLLYAQGKLSDQQKVDYAAKNNNLAHQYRQAGNLKLAIKYYEQALALNPQLVDARHQLRLALQEQSDHQIKISCAKQ
ncbi:Tetratricopeptide TPR_1 repeat-containing protein [Stanieria cyanosphaera PCC 7437]|uniref:Tetratricopeptide TPR_1 repeat-containing protein n=1 Tax=Stanieria cyanosphaera (strain ATCC 29371 / PCC 7437) TaxID=111780 RepID=K9XST8_STAC7|nr:GNAT family N-acetyltransferase [Stanieria cyanosphaera]AFZ35129.1 Tetratricopeptide TPR_1 repeat-containing protein [Stanieria cyanosphaera PCC 7437]